MNWKKWKKLKYFEHKEVLNIKYEKKLEHLKAKYRMNEDDHEEDEVPDDMQEYSELSVFNKTKFSEKEVKQAGAELCQAQGKLEFVWLWLDPCLLGLTSIDWISKFGAWN